MRLYKRVSASVLDFGPAVEEVRHRSKAAGGSGVRLILPVLVIVDGRNIRDRSDLSCILSLAIEIQ